MLGVNQGIIMVLAVVVIGGLVGSPGLGYEVAQGLAAPTSGSACSPRSPYSRSASRSTASRAACAGRNSEWSVTSESGGRAEAWPSDAIEYEGGRCGTGEPVAAPRGSPRSWWRRRRAGGLGERVRPHGGRELRHGHDGRERVGRCDRQRVRPQVRAREEPRLQGQHRRSSRRPAAVPGDGRRQGRGVLEDWNNILLKVNQKYVKSGAVINLGSNGVIGHIGWFVPTYLMKQYPQFKTWQGLKGKETSSRARSPARRGCSSAATRPTSRRTRS